MLTISGREGQPSLHSTAVTVHTILQLGHPVLRTPADPVGDFDKELRRLVADMARTMLDAPGAGLAAPQIGVGLRVFTYHVPHEGTGHLVNPTLEFPDDELQDGAEGCLSIRGLSFERRRRQRAIVHGCDQHGEPLTVSGSGFLARCFQHEVDHLDGVLYVDGLEPGERVAAMRAIRNRTVDATTAPSARR
jgi:peptide deformylase